MKKLTEKFVTNIWLIAVLMLKDLIETGKYIYNYFNKPNNLPTMETHLDWFDISVKLFMAIALMLVFRQYYAMKKYNFIEKAFAQILFEEQFKFDNILTDEKNKVIDRVKAELKKRVTEKFKGEMKLPQIEKMIDEYFEYHRFNLNEPL